MHRLSPLAHAARVCALRSLVEGLAALPLTDEAALVEAAEHAAADAVQTTAHLPDLPLTSAAATAVQLTVETECGVVDLDPAVAPGTPAAAALAALARVLQPALASACPRLGVVRLAACASVRACIAALAALQTLLTSPSVLKPVTCLSVLGAAARARAPAACAAARAAAVASFGEAVGAAPGALAALPARELAGVLADDGLEATELEAFSAVAAWCGAAPEARARALPHLVSAGVRLATLPPGALAALDAHPSVRACPETTRAVATAYVRLFVAAPRGGVHDGRRCEWATAAAAKAASPSPSSPSPSSPSPPPPAFALPPGGAETPPRRLRPSPGSVRVLAKRLCLE